MGPLAVGQNLQLQADAVPGEQRLQQRAARKQALARLAICGLAQILAARIAENGGEKHGGVLAIGFEQKDVGVGVLRPVSVHADFHPRMHDRTKGLREDHRQAAMGQLVSIARIATMRRTRVEGHQRIDAQKQAHAGLQSHRGVQGLIEHAVA